MKIKTWLLVFFLFGLALFPIYYKNLVLGLPFFPTVQKDIWDIEMEVVVKSSPDYRSIRFPVPKPSDRIIVRESQQEGSPVNLRISQSDKGALALWEGVASETKKILFKSIVEVKAKKFSLTRGKKEKIKGLSAKELKPYKEIPALDPATMTRIKEVEADILQSGSPPLKSLRALYYFVHEEISKKTGNNVDFNDVLSLMEGNSLQKAKLFNIFARRLGFPARVVGGLYLLPPRKADIRQKKKIHYWNEFYWQDKWIPVCTINGHFAYLPDNYLPLFKDAEGIKSVLGDPLVRLDIYNQKILSEEFSIKEYRKELKRKDSFFMSLSLFLLPIKTQNIFRILLLIPLGVIILSLLRNIVGIKTFGTFMPILLALFFKETSFIFGLSFFIFLIVLGVLERMLLEKLHLLVVPRKAIILTLVVLFLLIFTALNKDLKWFGHFTPALFPIVITTNFIERFSIMVVEEGLKKTLFVLLGTIFVSFCVYLLFIIPRAELIIFTYPELLFAIIGILIMIGRYTHYRITEIMRFREIWKPRKP